MRIDWWTLALQTVNVLVLIWLLARFFFRPIMDIVVKRQEEARKLLGDAVRAGQEANELRADADQARAQINAEREGLIAQARNAAQTEKENLLAQSSEKIAKLHDEAEAAIAHDRAAAQEAIIDHAVQLSVEIAQRLLERLPHRDILHAFVDDICREVRELSPETKGSFASAAATAHPIEVVTAEPLSGEETQYVRRAISEAIAAELPFAFRSDPAVIKGIELRGQNVIVRNSWRADLDQMRRELSHDKYARQS
jgi:F-type H+-transporting ATPase subunit b